MGPVCYTAPMTLRGRLLLSNLAMVLVPLALVIGLNSILLSFVQEGAPGPTVRIFGPWQDPVARPRRPLPTRQMLALTQTTLRKINVQTMANPNRLADQAFWTGLDEGLKGRDAGLAVGLDGKLLFMSPELGNTGVLSELPAYGDLEGLRPESTLANRFRLLGQWDWALDGGHKLSAYLLWVTQPWNREVETFSTVLLTGFFLSTLGVGMLFTWLTVRRVMGPLGQLQKASDKIASGDLSPSPGYHRRDELTPLFDAFEAMRERLEENRHVRDRYEADRRDLIAHIAHDLKTPVTAINGYVHGILDGVAATPERQRQYLEVIAAKARDLDRRTDELFFYSSLELGTLPYEFQSLDLGALVAGFWRDFAVEYGPQGMGGPDPVLPEGSLPFRGDPGKLRRVFTNLADNTVKFRRGDSVRWTWVLEDRGKDYLLRLTDDGVGISAAALPHVFDQFYREDRSRTTQVPGTGLGLAIVRRIVEDHGGKVSAQRIPQGGTAICLEFPRGEAGTP